ncbi:MAG: helix-turn-helix transcriptional regulator, partial [Alphaproteobacteria bacterium]|nr:helix-turn-helix transcriptional regulator [Alphaproteobacteria bacterium]
AETRLAVALARGICRKEYARSIGVQPSTVKTQVTNLFIKTGTRRESDLVRILTSVPRLAWPGR